MRAIAAIAWNTFREAVRSRVLYIIVIFALLLMASSGVVRELAISAQNRIVRDLGLATISWFSVAVAILVGIGLVYNELDKKSIYTIVSKPIARWQFLLGKYFGLLLTIYIIILVMSLFFLTVMHYQHLNSVDARQALVWEKTPNGYEVVPHARWVLFRHTLASVGVGVGHAVMDFFNIGNVTLDQTRHVNSIVFLIALELAILVAFAILYSSFSTPTLSAIFTVMTFVAGRLNHDIWLFAYNIKEKSEEGLSTTGNIIKYWLAMTAATIVPNLNAFKVNTLALSDQSKLPVVWFAWPDPWWTILPSGAIPYALFYCAAVLCLAILIFRSRNFK